MKGKYNQMKIKKILPLLFTGLFLLSACSSKEDKVIAYVDTDADKRANFNITYGDFMSEYRFNLMGQELDENNEENAEQIKEIKRTVIEYLTTERVRLQAAEDMGLALTGEEQEEAVKNSEDVLSQFAETFVPDAKAELGEDAEEALVNAKAKELSEKYFTDAGLSPEIVYVWQRNWMIEQKLIDAITADVTVDDGEADKIISDYTEEAKNSYINDPATYNTINDYLTFYIPENSRVARIIAITFAAERTQQLSNLRAINESENADILRDEFSAEIKEKTDEAYEKLKTELFADVLGEYSSESFGTASDGFIFTPESGFLSSGYSINKEFVDAVFSLEKTGDYTEPVLTDYGYIIAEYTSDAKVNEREIEYIKEELGAELLDNAKSAKIAELEAQWNEKYPYHIDYDAIGLEAE